MSLVDVKPVSPISQNSRAISCGNGAKLCGLDGQALADFCRAKFRQGVADELAEITGQSRSSAEKWLRQETLPSAEALAYMIGEFGPAFIAACMPTSSHWAARWAQDEKQRSLENQLETIRAARPVNGERQHG